MFRIRIRITFDVFLFSTSKMDLYSWSDMQINDPPAWSFMRWQDIFLPLGAFSAPRTARWFWGRSGLKVRLKSAFPSRFQTGHTGYSLNQSGHSRHHYDTIILYIKKTASSYAVRLDTLLFVIVVLKPAVKMCCQRKCCSLLYVEAT